MSTSQEAPALIQYACERCKTRFVLPPSSRKLNLGGKLKAFSMGLGKTFKQHEGLGAGYDASRRQLLAKMDDEAYQSFVQSFRFCHECRQFVCNECWSTSRRSCLTCVAKSMTGTVRPRPPFAPTGPEIPRPIVASAAPRKGRLRRDALLVGLAIAVVMVSLEAGILLVNATSGPGATATPTLIADVPAGTPTAVPSITVAPSASASASATATPTATPTPTPTPTPIATPTAAAVVTPAPVITPVPTPRATPKPTLAPLEQPQIACTLSGVTATCHVTNGAKYYASPTDKTVWSYDTATGTGSTAGTRKSGTPWATFSVGNTAMHFVTLTVTRGTAKVTAHASVG